MKRWWAVAVIIGLLLVVACGARPTSTPVATDPGILPNIASEYCLAQGYQLEALAQDSGETGYCLFPDGDRCELWAFYEGECAPRLAPAQGSP